MQPICGYEQYILDVVQDRGQVVSLRRLAQDHDLDVSWAFACVNRLARRGLVRIRRNGQGRPMEISAAYEQRR